MTTRRSRAASLRLRGEVLWKANPNVSNIEIRPATDSDLAYVGSNLRAADFGEFVMSSGRDPRLAFARRAKGSADLSCGVVDGTPACIFGVMPQDGWASPWFMGTDQIEGPAVARAMLTVGRKLFSKWVAEYGHLENSVYDHNELHKKYIRALGCELAPEPIIWGLQQAPMRTFTYVRTDGSSRRVGGTLSHPGHSGVHGGHGEL